MHYLRVKSASQNILLPARQEKLQLRQALARALPRRRAAITPPASRAGAAPSRRRAPPHRPDHSPTSGFEGLSLPTPLAHLRSARLGRSGGPVFGPGARAAARCPAFRAGVTTHGQRARLVLIALLRCFNADFRPSRAPPGPAPLRPPARRGRRPGDRRLRPALPGHPARP